MPFLILLLMSHPLAVSEIHFIDLDGYHPLTLSCIPCEAHGQTVKKNNQRARKHGSFGADRSHWTTLLEFDNMYIMMVASGADPY